MTNADESTDILARLRLRAYLSEHGNVPDAVELASQKKRRQGAQGNPGKNKPPRTRWQIGLRTAAGALGCVAVVVAAAIFWASSRQPNSTTVGMASSGESTQSGAKSGSAKSTSSPATLSPAKPPTTKPSTGAPDAATGASGASGAHGNDGKVDINVASAKQLEDLPGIGPALAQRIVDYRDANGQFSSVESLSKVKGIGPAKLARLHDMAKV